METSVFGEILVDAEIDFPDKRLYEITIKHLLQHTAGWSDVQPTMYWGVKSCSRDLGIYDRLPTTREIVNWFKKKPLVHDPGASMCYSNFGYCVLGRVIEKVTGLSYEDYVLKVLFAGTKIKGMNIGSTTEHKSEEVCYHYFGNDVPCIYSRDEKILVKAPYGGFDLRLYDSHGGWITSAIDLAKFLTCLDGSRQPQLLDEKHLTLMLKRPEGCAGNPGSPVYYGCGWMVRETEDGKNFWHVGQFPGTTALMVRGSQGQGWVVLLNWSCDDSDKTVLELDRLMWKCWYDWKEKPEYDLFTQFY
eukprot:TRINITY_DN10239_c0_g1_i3.p1 TRINITY_DN10239_c0_g1~~TRINITY_DN10239_c0_g1_i3.p1  ORF type:complete len:303 (+),score=59.53 TRINITY_DN10239_c0_g1_i3:374-1282(+)